LELEGELDGAGAADLVEGAEAAALPTGAQRAGQHLRRVTKQWAAKGVVGTAEVWMVEDVEGDTVPDAGGLTLWLEG